MPPKQIVLLVAASCLSLPTAAATIPDSLLQPADLEVEFWLQARQDSIVDLVKADADLVGSLTAARKHIDDVLPDNACDDSLDVPSVARACQFSSNLNAYTTYVLSQSCHIDRALADVTDPNASTDSITPTIAAANDATTAAVRAAADIFTVPPQPVGNAFALFEAPIPSEGCPGTSAPRLAIVQVPADSRDATDKLILGYAVVLSEVTLESNRPFMLATAERIALADARWKQFEANVLHDQFPWETLVFNDWLAPRSDRFRGTLMYPPTRQIRALHPVPTALLDVSGGESLFRPRITIEVFGLRMLDPDAGYTPKRAISIIATLKAEDNESHGWGLLYVWKRASVGVVHQKRDDDDVIAIVVGIDLANQIESQRNKLMVQWQTLRDKLKAP